MRCSTKQRFRCPIRSDANLSQRKNLQPQWRCKSNGHEFETPTSETISITTYEARYGSTFRKCDPALTPAVLAAAVIRPNDQMSIKEIDLAQIEASLGPSAKSIVDRFVAGLEPPAFETAEADEVEGSAIERQRKVLRQIAVRRGQKKFQDKLIKRYGGSCQVTGCDFIELLEAAHIDPYADIGDNGVGNELLLRSDIHTLFDLGYVRIDAESLTVLVHPSLSDSGYGTLSGRGLQINGTSGAATNSLKKRQDLFVTKWW
jgi:putative restriction endonuclease